MILTGKAKEDFLKYYDVEEKWFDEEYIPLFENALIIEWMDSVGIVIEIGIHTRTYDDVFWRGKINNEVFDDLEYKRNRNEATKSSIVKANEIYNEIKN